MVLCIVKSYGAEMVRVACLHPYLENGVVTEQSVVGISLTS